jgi:hypothetical protein
MWSDSTALLQEATTLNSDPNLTMWGPVAGAPLGSTSYAVPPLGAGATKKFYRLKK